VAARLQQVCAELGCDWLVYNDLDDCQALIKSLNSARSHPRRAAAWRRCMVVCCRLAVRPHKRAHVRMQTSVRP
jgi:hypothetical protein